MKTHRPIMQRQIGATRQRGAAAIEFALLFTIFFAVFYAAIGYSTWFLLKQGLTQAATNGARAALRVSPLNYSGAAYNIAITTVATNAVTSSLSWAPPSVLTAITGAGGITVTAALTADPAPAINTTRVTVKVTYLGAPLIPVLNLPLIGPVPNLPTSLEAIAVQ